MLLTQSFQNNLIQAMLWADIVLVWQAAKILQQAEQALLCYGYKDDIVYMTFQY